MEQKYDEESDPPAVGKDAGGGEGAHLSGAPASQKDEPQEEPHHSRHSRFSSTCAALFKVITDRPVALLLPLLVLALLLTVGIWGCLQVAAASKASAKDRVVAVATDVASWYRQHIADAYAPVLSLSLTIRHDPGYPKVARLFNDSAPELLAMSTSGTLASLQLAPSGVVRLSYPPDDTPEDIDGDMLGHDLLAPTHMDHGNGISIVAGRRMALIGPLDLGDDGIAMRAMLPVFVRGVVPNTSFDAPDPVTPLCGQPCAYDASTGSVFWGLAVALINLSGLHVGNTSRLLELERMGYTYELLAPPADMGVGSSGGGGSGAAGSLVRLAGSSRAPKDPVEVIITMQNLQWYLRAAPHDSWTPSWFAPMLAVVIVVSLAMAVLLFAVMVSRRQHQQLLEALLPREMIDDLRKDSNTHRLGPRMLEAATTADLLLDLLADLLEGTAPDLRDIVLIRQQILQNMDIYRPLNLSSQLKGANLDDDVTQALMHQLGGQFSFSMTGAGDETGDDEGAPTRSGASLAKSTTVSQHDYATLSGALAMLLAPQGGSTGWYDSGPDVSDATSDAALPTHDNEAAVSASPRLSTHPVFARAASHLVSRSNSPDGVGLGSGSLGAVVPHPPRERPRTANQGGAERERRGSILVSVGADGGPGLVPTDSVADGGPAGTGSIASTSAVVAVTDGGGAAANGPSGSAASSLFGNILGHGGGKHRRESNLAGIFAQRGRRKSALLTVSIFEGEGGGGGGSSCGLPAGGGGGDKGSDSEAQKAGKTLSNGSHPDLVVQEIPASHMGSSRLGVALTGTSRRSLTNQGMVAGMAGAGGSVAQAMMMAAKKPPTPPAPVIEEVERVLAGADSWTFNTYKLREVTQGHPLSALGFYLIQRAGLIPRLKLKPAVLARLLRHIEAGYVDNPYHNATHAADVLQTLHVIIHGAQLHVHYLDPLGLLAAYWAAVVHDYGHPGLTNDFLINTADPLAVRYNDRSPLENHHAAASFSAMRRPGLDLLSPLSGEQKSNFRKQVIDMVLATDMKQHFSLISHFVTVHRLAQYTAQSAAALGAAPHKAGTSGSGGSTPGMSRQTSNTRELVPVSITAPVNADAAPRPVDDTERLLSLQIAIKAADIGHLGEQLDVHRKWLAGLEEEFFRQGDKEKALGLPISPLFDRAKQGVSKSQVGFYDFVALPLVHALSSAFPGAQPLMRTFITNYNHYRSMDGQPTVSEPRSGKLGVASFNRQPASLPLTPSGNT